MAVNEVKIQNNLAKIMETQTEISSELPIENLLEYFTESSAVKRNTKELFLTPEQIEHIINQNSSQDTFPYAACYQLAFNDINNGAHPFKGEIQNCIMKNCLNMTEMYFILKTKGGIM